MNLSETCTTTKLNCPRSQLLSITWDATLSASYWTRVAAISSFKVVRPENLSVSFKPCPRATRTTKCK